MMMMIETFFLPRNSAVIMNDTDQTININLSIIKNYDWRDPDSIS